MQSLLTFSLNKNGVFMVFHVQPLECKMKH